MIEFIKAIPLGHHPSLWITSSVAQALCFCIASCFCKITLQWLIVIILFSIIHNQPCDWLLNDEPSRLETKTCFSCLGWYCMDYGVCRLYHDRAFTFIDLQGHYCIWICCVFPDCTIFCVSEELKQMLSVLGLPGNHLPPPPRYRCPQWDLSLISTPLEVSFSWSQTLFHLLSKPGCLQYEPLRY